MDLKEIPLEKKRNGDDEGASDPKLKVKTEEEEQPDHYSKLQAPAEDLYAQAYFGDSPAKAGKQSEGTPRLYRIVCLVLALICLVLLLVVVVLCVKIQTGSDCPETDASTCNYQRCRVFFPNAQAQACASQNCPVGCIEYGGSCFYLSTTRLTWDMSQTKCRALGGSLVVISNPGIQSFLAAKGMRLTYWMGLRRNEATQWSWVNNNPLEKSYWVDNPTYGDCGLFVSSAPNNKNWKKESCEASTYYICQLNVNVQA